MTTSSAIKTWLASRAYPTVCVCVHRGTCQWSLPVGWTSFVLVLDPCGSRNLMHVQACDLPCRASFVWCVRFLTHSKNWTCMSTSCRIVECPTGKVARAVTDDRLLELRINGEQWKRCCSSRRSNAFVHQNQKGPCANASPFQKVVPFTMSALIYTA